MEKTWLWISLSSPTGQGCCLRWSWCRAYILESGTRSYQVDRVSSNVTLDVMRFFSFASAGAMAVRCSPLTDPGSSAGAATTLISAKAASKPANTTPDTRSDGLTNRVSPSHRVNELKWLKMPIVTVNTTRPDTCSVVLTWSFRVCCRGCVGNCVSVLCDVQVSLQRLVGARGSSWRDTTAASGECW